ncbi:MAG TPA: efflux RND transporter periplasmic adaptor subunit [Puia sp.]|uniref:efflux RND transporter periplasmic adaptor subunit n=1 Tax=Puia sp. TaxID=2045100 RepID=UPI002BF7F2D6|nr:efflux RND transporter periplasmic adaptor subunit [Puia sp.]HVU97484.1 efflux RND transporter periplasmic adaptor subunit [Puia sp.]
MHKILSVVIASSLLLAACGSGSVQKDDSLAGKKQQLAALKDQQEKLTKQISTLEDQIAKIDTAAGSKEKAKLVALTAITPTSFTHYIDLQGNVDAENYSNVAPKGNGGVVREVLVKQGDHVNKGQLLLRLDDAIQRQQLANAQTQLAYAKDIYGRRKNLWDQKIGTEVDLINAKNQVDQAETQVKIAQEQLDWTNVYADIPGTVNTLTVKVGEAFSPATLGGAQLQIINTDNLKVVVQVPELYQERIHVGTPVKIAFPGLNNKEVFGSVRVVGKVINTGNRAFQVEIHLPSDRDIRANQVAVVKLEDYKAKDVLTIPINTLQTDEKGKYVMVAATEGGKKVAHKKQVTIGQSYADKVEVTSGLQQGDQLVTDGFQGLYEGQPITIQ